MSTAPAESKRRNRAFVVARGIAGAVCALAAGYAVAFWAIALIQGNASAAAPAFWHGLLVFALAIIIFGCVMYLVGRIFVTEQRQNIFQVIRDAMRRIAQGDFDVAVPFDAHDRNNLMGEVVSSLNEMAEALKKLDAMRQEFVSDVSHEIQSPLTSIAGFALALHDDGLSVDQRSHYLDIIEAESKRLSGLSDNLLKLSALDSKALPVTRAPYRLDAQLRSVILSCELQWQEKRISLDVELDALTIDADEALLRQVWGNLLHNAIKFTPSEGRIAISCHRGSDDAVVRVADSGIGIDANDLAQVFDRFFKADKSRTAEKGAGGSGLGLSIVSKIVSLHEGTVRASSDGIGHGATLEVRLPITPRAH